MGAEEEIIRDGRAYRRGAGIGAEGAEEGWVGGAWALEQTEALKREGRQEKPVKIAKNCKSTEFLAYLGEAR